MRVAAGMVLGWLLGSTDAGALLQTRVLVAAAMAAAAVAARCTGQWVHH